MRMTNFDFLRRPIPLRRPLPVTGLLARLRASRSGIALTEFAISLPIFVTLLFGGLEIISLVMAHMRMSQVARVPQPGHKVNRLEGGGGCATGRQRNKKG